MKINIAWLYPDILNLHGDRGNVMALLNIAASMGVEVNLIKIHNKLSRENLKDIDFAIMGAGQLRDMERVARDMDEYKESLCNYIDNGGYMLVTGSTGCLFGSSYTLEDKNKVYEGFGFFDMEARALERTKMPMLTREVYGDDIYWTMEDGMEIIGCQIQRMDFDLRDKTKALGKLVYGYGNNCSDGLEGARYKNLMFTNTVGPLLACNPWLGIKLLVEILNAKGFEVENEVNSALTYNAKEAFLLKKEFIRNKKKLPNIIYKEF